MDVKAFTAYSFALSKLLHFQNRPTDEFSKTILMIPPTS